MGEEVSSGGVSGRGHQATRRQPVLQPVFMAPLRPRPLAPPPWHAPDAEECLGRQRHAVEAQH